MSELKVINAYQLTTNTEDSDVYIHNDDFCCGGDLVECYLKSEADKVIAEKDAEIVELKKQVDELDGVKKSAEQILQNLLDCGLIKEWYFNGTFNVVLKADDPHTQIAELKSEIKRKEAVEQRWFEQCMEARSEAIRLKRALWLARAERARTEQCYENYSYYIHRHQKTMYGGTYRPYIAWLEKWDEVERKCRDKAEEYK